MSTSCALIICRFNLFFSCFISLCRPGFFFGMRCVSILRRGPEPGVFPVGVRHVDDASGIGLLSGGCSGRSGSGWTARTRTGSCCGLAARSRSSRSGGAGRPSGPSSTAARTILSSIARATAQPAAAATAATTATVALTRWHQRRVLFFCFSLPLPFSFSFLNYNPPSSSSSSSSLFQVRQQNQPIRAISLGFSSFP